MTRTSTFYDPHAVQAACASASSLKDAIEALGHRAHGANYQRLRDACHRYNIPLPQPRTPVPTTTTGRRMSVFTDDTAVRDALAAATTMAQACRSLGLVPATKNYRRLREAAGHLGIPVPAPTRTGNPTPYRPARTLRARQDLIDMSTTELAAIVAGTGTLTELLYTVGLPRTKENRDLLVETLTGHGLPVPNGRTRRRTTNEEIFTVGYVNPQTLKRRIEDQDLLPHAQCAQCGQPRLWNGQRLVLELDHINGDTRDNRLTNLRFLCPNCHSQTPTFRGRNITYGPNTPTRTKTDVATS